MWLDKAAAKTSNKSNKKYLNAKSNSTRQHVRKGKSSTMAQVPGMRLNLEPDLKRQKTTHEGLNWELPVSAPNTVSRKPSCAFDAGRLLPPQEEDEDMPFDLIGLQSTQVSRHCRTNPAATVDPYFRAVRPEEGSNQRSEKRGWEKRRHSQRRFSRVRTTRAIRRARCRWSADSLEA